MLLGFELFNFNSASGFIPTGPPAVSGVSGQSTGVTGFQNASKFGVNVTTVVRPNSTIPAGLSCTIFADMSIWCPTLQSFIPPEQTNIASKFSDGSGS